MMIKLMCSVLVFGLAVDIVVCRSFYPGYSGLYSFDFNAYPSGLSPYVGGNQLNRVLSYSPVEGDQKAGDQKRAYMRLGKRAYMRLGKRSDDSGNVDTAETDESKMEKRARLRLG